jgi:hypothetical protein
MVFTTVSAILDWFGVVGFAISGALVASQAEGYGGMAATDSHKHEWADEHVCLRG